MSRDISLSYEDGSTLTQGNAILQQYQIALLTEPTEFSSDPTFGLGLETFIAEANNEISGKAIRQRIVSYTRDNFPEIRIRNILITRPQDNQVSIRLDITVVPFGLNSTIRKDVAAS